MSSVDRAASTPRDTSGARPRSFAGNELVAVYRIRVGRRIGSAAVVADGLHARIRWVGHDLRAEAGPSTV